MQDELPAQRAPIGGDDRGLDVELVSLAWPAHQKRYHLESYRTRYWGLEREHEMARKDYPPEQAIRMSAAKPRS